VTDLADLSLPEHHVPQRLVADAGKNAGDERHGLVDARSQERKERAVLIESVRERAAGSTVSAIPIQLSR
jgi:hypothetical protein